MRNSLCWTGVWEPGAADDHLRITMTTAGGKDGRAAIGTRSGGDSVAGGDPGSNAHATHDTAESQHTDDDDAPLLLTGRLWPTFAARTVVLNPGSSLPFAAADWNDALIVIESGELEVETTSGLRRRFGAGEILWFAGLNLRVLRSHGAEPAVLKAVSRGRRD
jgi:hypothetical protein